MRVSEGPGVRGRLTACALLAALLAGCGGDPDPVALPAVPRRVICASPAVAEIVWALGCGDRVVGVSSFTDFPPEAREKPVIGGALAPAGERILGLKPDLILSQGQSEALAAFARRHRIAFYTVPLDALGDVQAALSRYGAVLGVSPRAEKLRREMEAGLAAIPRREPVSVFLALGHAPGDLSGLMTAGRGTFLHELMGIAGGSNVFSDLSLPWPRISRESLIRRAPAVILDVQAVASDEARRAALVGDWERVGFSAGQVRILDEEYLLRPGPRAVLAARCMADALAMPFP